MIYLFSYIVRVEENLGFTMLLLKPLTVFSTQNLPLLGNIIKWYEGYVRENQNELCISQSLYLLRILYKEDGKDSFTCISVSMSEQEAEQDWIWIQEQLVPKVQFYLWLGWEPIVAQVTHSWPRRRAVYPRLVVNYVFIQVPTQL